MNAILKRILVLGLMLTLIGSINCSALVSKESHKTKSIVFLLDSSGSMKENDPNRLAIDSIAQLIYSLP